MHRIKSIKLKQKKLIIIAAIAAAAVVTGSLYARATGSDTASAATTVQEATATVGDVNNTISGSGTLESDASLSVSVPEGIKIKEVLVSAGDTVKKGQKIASVYPASVAKVLLEVNETVEDLEDKIDDLDDYEDTSSDDYLEYLVYSEQLEEATAQQEELEEMLESVTGFSYDKLWSKDNAGVKKGEPELV